VADVGGKLDGFYRLRASEEPAHDPEARLRFQKAVPAAKLVEGERVLDVGAKRGGLGSYILETASRVAYTGTDLNEENVAAGRDAGLDMRKSDAADALPFDRAAFDCVFCLEILEHLVTPLSLLQEVRRVLIDDGRVVISVPSPYSWVEVARELFHLPDTEEGHLNVFTAPVMENLAALAGLRIDRRLGTSVRVPMTTRLVSTNSILARSRIYILRPSATVTFARRELM
jgi:SAM-dependent methyltransferase